MYTGELNLHAKALNESTVGWDSQACMQGRSCVDSMPDSVNYFLHVDLSSSVVLRIKLASKAVARYGIAEGFRDPGIGRNLISAIYSNRRMMPSFSLCLHFCWSRMWWNPSNCLECSVHHQGTATPLACFRIDTSCLRACFFHFICMVQLAWQIDRFLFIQKWLKKSWHAEALSSFHYYYLLVCTFWQDFFSL